MFDVALLPQKVLEAIEADTFWCLSKLLDGIQDNYIFAQPGIQRQVRRLGELVARIDAPLHAHLQDQGVEYMQFAFRWMNCLLMREMSVRNIIRMWDTYLAEGPDAFSDFHLYVCSVFLHKWTDKLRTMDFQGIIMFLQSLPPRAGPTRTQRCCSARRSCTRPSLATPPTSTSSIIRIGAIHIRIHQRSRARVV